MKFKVVGILGQAGHGKDTCADILRDELGFCRLAFADELKMDIYKAFENFEECSIAAQNSRKRAPWVRRLQQVYGTQWCRNRLGNDYWLLRWEPEARRLLNGGAFGIAVTDVRFPNELSFLKMRWGAYILYMDRPGHCEPGVDPTHESEMYVRGLRDKADAVVVNDCSLVELKSRVLSAVSCFWNSSGQNRGVDSIPTLL